MPLQRAYSTSDQFVDCIGVCTSIVSGSQTSGEIALIQAAGIRSYREATSVGNTAGQAALLALCNAIPRSNVCILTGMFDGGPFAGQLSQANVNSQITQIAAIAASGVNVIAVEGLNEPTGNTNPPTSSAQTVQWNTWVWNGVYGLGGQPAQPLLTNTLVTTPAMDGDTTEVPTDITNGMAPVMNAVNYHWYTLSRPPETNGWGQVISATVGYDNTPYVKQFYVQPYLTAKGVSSLPIYITECGAYGSSSTPALALSQVSSSDYAAEAIFWPRFLLYNFIAGFTKFYHFCATDSQNSAQGGFGLIGSGNTPKPVYTATKNLITLMSDVGTQPSLASLNYTLSGNTTNVYSALFSKINGNFVLCLWIGSTLGTSPVIWNIDTKTDIAPSTPQSVTITVSGVTGYQTAAPSTINFSGGLISGGIIASAWSGVTNITGGAVTVNVVDAVTLIQFSNTITTVPGQVTVTAGLTTATTQDISWNTPSQSPNDYVITVTEIT